MNPDPKPWSLHSTLWEEKIRRTVPIFFTWSSFLRVPLSFTYLVDNILEVDLAGRGEDPEGEHGVLAEACPRHQVQLLALDLVEGLPGVDAAFLAAESKTSKHEHLMESKEAIPLKNRIQAPKYWYDEKETKNESTHFPLRGKV
jgi:hypothetical protein